MKKHFFNMDLILLFLTIIFCIFGCIMVFSSSSIAAVLRYRVPANYFFLKQILFVVASFLVGITIIIHMPTSKYKMFAPFLLLAIIASLIGLFAFGFISNGAQSWYNLGFFSFQPSEFAKSILIIFMAVYYDRYSKSKKSNPKSSIIPLAIGLFIAILVAMEPDLGGAIIIAAISYLIFIAAPIGRKIKTKVTLILLAGVALLAITGFATHGAIFSEHQINRLKFLNPCQRYLESSGYQVCNGFIAMRNGGLFGVGLGNSSQKRLYLPEAHTDFIFPIVVEELGLVTGLLVIIGYILMLFRLYKLAKSSNNIRNSILAYGTFLLLLLHVLVNLVGVLGLAPLTGVPLPFLSYGGSFTINLLIMLFICQRVSIETKDEQKNQKISQI